MTEAWFWQYARSRIHEIENEINRLETINHRFRDLVSGNTLKSRSKRRTSKDKDPEQIAAFREFVNATIQGNEETIEVLSEEWKNLIHGMELFPQCDECFGEGFTYYAVAQDERRVLQCQACYGSGKSNTRKR